MITPDPLALSLRELRGSPETEAAGHADAEDAHTLHRILARLGYFIAPTVPDDALRLAVHQARAAHAIATRPELRGADAEALARAAVTSDAQRAQDHVTMAAMQRHLAREIGHG
jgi:hypothetical protein